MHVGLGFKLKLCVSVLLPWRVGVVLKIQGLQVSDLKLRRAFGRRAKALGLEGEVFRRFELLTG